MPALTVTSCGCTAGKCECTTREFNNVRTERTSKMLIDQFSAQLADMSRTVRAFPVLESCAAAGVAVPANSVWASLEDLDASLNSAFGVLDLNTLAGRRQWEARIKLKGEILAAEMVRAPEKAIDEKAVLHACNLLRQHGIPAPTEQRAISDQGYRRRGGRAQAFGVRSASPQENLRAAGLIHESNTIVTKPIAAKPDPAMVRSIFASPSLGAPTSELELDMPASGKISMAALNRAMTARDVAPHRRMQIKELLAAAQVLAE
jgi:hypothetical protein